MLIRQRLNGFTAGLILLNAALAILLPSGARSSGTPVSRQQTLLDLSHEGVLMGVSAHPDDEDGATLAYYRMKYGITTYSVFLTRGEGGQNEIGPELYQQLGVLRTEETKQAARIQETEAAFLNFEDFGYSKTATETFHRWGGKEEVVRRLVYMIRKLRPDVIITNHNTINGHGHHQATAITLIDAFDRAGDSTSFPDQLRKPGITLWQPRKLYFRLFNRSMGSPDVVVPIDEVNKVRNRSYIDIAIEALSKHRTQGMDRIDLRRWMRNVSLYRLVRENSSYERDSTSFFSGIDLWSQERDSVMRELHSEVNTLSLSLRQDSLLYKVSQTLLLVRQARNNANRDAFESRTLYDWQSELEKLGELTGDFTAMVRLEDSVLVPGELISLHVVVHSDSSAIDDVHSRLTLPDAWAVRESSMNAAATSPGTFSMEYRVAMGGDVRYTMPKPPFLYVPIDLDQSITVSVAYRANDVPLSLTRTVQIEVAPPQALSVQPPVVWLSPSSASDGASYVIEVKNFVAGPASGSVRTLLPTGWNAPSPAFTISGENETEQLPVTVRPPGSVPPGNYTMRWSTENFETTGEVHLFDVRVNRTSDIGIVESYDNTLETVAKELGVHAVLLGDKFLENLDLMQFSTIIVDIRAYLVRKDLIENNSRLLDYVRRGGNLVVMYQKDSEWKPEYAPYPFALSRERVTREDAPIEILSPDHPLLNKPNVLGDQDWTGWVQERGVYFPEKVAPEYTHLVSTHDPDEPPLTTGYLVANVGRGSYVYTSLVWYRQLKERNPGAYRAFANMISYPSYRKK
jgi:LmbE family N-acetylglucosaminyl deacetylase